MEYLFKACQVCICVANANLQSQDKFMDVARDEDLEPLMEANDWLWQNLKGQEEEKNKTKTSSLC